MDVTLGTLHEYPLISSFLIGFPLWNSRDTAVLLQTRAVTGKSKDSRRIIWFQSHLCGLLFLLDSSWSYSRLSWHVVCCNVLLCWPRHGCWRATCRVGESRNLQRWAVLPAILGLVDSTGVSSHGLWIIREPCMTLLEFVNKEDWVGHPWGEANEINQPLPICHNDQLKNKEDTEKAVI